MQLEGRVAHQAGQQRIAGAVAGEDGDVRSARGGGGAAEGVRVVRVVALRNATPGLRGLRGNHRARLGEVSTHISVYISGREIAPARSYLGGRDRRLQSGLRQ